MKVLNFVGKGSVILRVYFFFQLTTIHDKSAMFDQNDGNK